MNKNIPPPSPSRVSVPIDAETLEVFQRLAKVANQSTGKAIAEWLRDTVEAAELMASTMERARAAPKVVTAELHAMLLGMADQTKELQDKYAKFKGPMDGAAMGGGLPTAGAARAVADLMASPPSCNTGGKLSKTQATPRKVNSRFPLPPAKVQAHANTNGVPPKAPK